MFLTVFNEESSIATLVHSMWLVEIAGHDEEECPGSWPMRCCDSLGIPELEEKHLWGKYPNFQLAGSLLLWAGDPNSHWLQVVSCSSAATASAFLRASMSSPSADVCLGRTGTGGKGQQGPRTVPLARDIPISTVWTWLGAYRSFTIFEVLIRRLSTFWVRLEYQWLSIFY